jgi:acyl carrier protein
MAAIEQITGSLLRAVEELNQERSAEEKIPLSPDTTLFGKMGHLDSLGLVNLVLMAERNIQEDFGCAITLADERALSEEKSPFLTINSMASYVNKLLAERGKAGE